MRYRNVQHLASASSNRTAAALCLCLSLLAVFASAVGVFQPSLYQEVVTAGSLSELLRFGSIAQDLVSLPLGVLLAGLSIACLRRPGVKRFVSMLGLSAYFFYAYGLYVIQGQYTALYLVYLAIFGLSIYSLVFGLSGLDPRVVERLRMPRALALSISAFLLLILVVLTPVWLIRMAPDVTARVPGEVYGVFVLDLGIVFPVLALTAIYLIRRKALGHVLAGIALVKAFTLCFSVFLGEGLKPFHGFQVDSGMLVIFGALTACSGLLGGLYLFRLAVAPVDSPPGA